MIKPQLLNACQNFLRPIVRMLLRGGVTWKEFSELSKEVYVDIARRDYGIQGRATNRARVSMITGLSRREVTRICNVLAGRGAPKEMPEDRISRILSGWFSDPEFQNADGTPAALPRDGDRSLADLFKRYGGDLPHGALFKELAQLGLLEEAPPNEFRVLSRHYTRGLLDPSLVWQMGVALHDHAATLAHNVNSERKSPARFEGIASNANMRASDIQRFATVVEDAKFDQ